MNIEFLYINACPASKRAREILDEVMTEEDIRVPVKMREIRNFDEAVESRFPGSPTIRINGLDVDTSSRESGDISMSCRIYEVDGELKGVPGKDMIRETIKETSEPEPPAETEKGYEFA